MTANRHRRHGKRTFWLWLALATMAQAADLPDAGWRLTVIPSSVRPAMHEEIRNSRTALLTVARHAGYGELEYATTRGAWRWAREFAQAHGAAWLEQADVVIRRDRQGVIDRILITGDDPLLPALTQAPDFYEKFEPLLGDRFHVIIPDRTTIALYPRFGGEIPPGEASALLEMNRRATYPVSREVFSATRRGLVGAGVLEE
jgi:hypothetical protein